jgi:hypothetical protein
MVAGRAHQRIGVPNTALQHRIDRRDDAAGREAGDLETAGTERGENAGVATPAADRARMRAM